MVRQPSRLLWRQVRRHPHQVTTIEEFAVQTFLAKATEDVLDLLEEVAEEMVSLFSISKSEAVARINAQWPGQHFLEDSELILHEDPYYWALFIYYDGDVPDWNPSADRSSWKPSPAPDKGSDYWTLPQH